MNDSNDEEFRGKLLTVFKKITGSVNVTGKPLDSTYIEKLLSQLKIESDSNSKCDEYLIRPEILQWLSETFKLWKAQSPRSSVAAFVIQFMGILCRKKKGFIALQEINALDQLIAILESCFIDNTNLKVVFIKLLNDAISHNSGCEWVITNKHWKLVIKWFLSHSNFYVEQEGLNFYRKFLKQIDLDGCLVDEMLHEALLPLNDFGKKTQDIRLVSDCLKFTTSLKLLIGILRMYTNNNSSVVCYKLSKSFDVEKSVKYLLENCSHEDTLEMASCLFVLHSVMKFHNKEKLLSMDNIPSDILDVFNILLHKNEINCIIKTSKFCQVLWDEMRKECNCESSLGMHFIIFQFIPLCALKTAPESKIFDSYMNKLFNLTSPTTQKFGYALRNRIKRNVEVKKWALKGVLTVTGNMDSLKHDEAVLIFQSLAYTLLLFVPVECHKGKLFEDTWETFLNGMCLDSEFVPLLSAVLSSLCLLIEKFKINWAESLESLCLLKMSSHLLEITNMSCILFVQTLLLIKLAILNSMSFSLAFLLNKTEDSSFECLLPLLYKHMHNPNWEIRDSCIEVVTTITELAETKFPSLQQLLLEKDFCSLVHDIMEGDSESYVRASAIKALSAMVKIESFRPRLNEFDLPRKMMSILQTESEGIVRRDAVLLLKQIYLSFNLNPDICSSLYEIMCHAALWDLHWEVKVNSLFFWESVIERAFVDQGMIDGFFPRVTFSKDRKKIVTMTAEEIKSRLDKALAELSKTGCLNVLMSTLNDDCDYQVVRKSAEILTGVLNTLKRFDVIDESDQSSGNRMATKRKHEDGHDEFIESSGKTSCKEAVDDDSDLHGTTEKSDAIIEEIVNELDINLLVSTHKINRERISPSERKTALQEVKPEVFLHQMRNFDSKTFLNDKKKWLLTSNDGFKSLINDIIMVNSICETNIMDCY